MVAERCPLSRDSNAPMDACRVDSRDVMSVWCVFLAAPMEKNSEADFALILLVGRDFND